MKRAALVVAGCLALATQAPTGMTVMLASAALHDTGPFTVAVLRRDGIVVPFAAFDGRRWQTPWPADVRTQDLPISLADVPDRWWGRIDPPKRLTLWSAGQRTGEVAITGLTTTRLMCEPRLSLRSDYKSSAAIPPPFELPHPKDGLLVGGEVSIGRIDAVERDSAEWKAALPVITPHFNEAENAAALRFARWRHPFGPDERRARPITIEAIYRAPMDTPGTTAYFVETARQYPPGPEDKDGCGLTTFGWGWVLLGKGKPRVQMAASVTYCDRDAVRYMLPFGTVTADGKTYWMFQYAGFDAEWYEVMRPTPGGVEPHASYPAGTCAP